MFRMSRSLAQVLLVDDDWRGSAIRKELLETQLGLKVWYFSHPEQALLNLRLAAWDLLITDFHMPGLNGAQLAQAVRRTHPSLPILMLTGDLLAASNAGVVSAVLDKTIPPDKFLAAVSSLVTQYRRYGTRIQHVS